MPNIYQLKVTLERTDPPIWRRLVVPGTLNFARLHRVLQDAMGWEDSHLHSFDVGGIQIGIQDPDQFSFGSQVQAEKQYTLDRVVRSQMRFTYLYDFGDCWTHEILVEKITTGEPDVPHCVAGERACPPEDCGGVTGYAELVQALADKTHERHEELAAWIPAGWSPEHFDLGQSDRLVARHRPEPGRPRPAKESSGRARTRE